MFRFARSAPIVFRSSRFLGTTTTTPTTPHRAATTTTAPPPEYQQAIDAVSGKYYYYDIKTGVSTWKQPTFFYPVGAGVDVSPGMAMLGGDKIHGNPFAPLSPLVKGANVVAAVGVTISVIKYFWDKREGADEAGSAEETGKAASQ